MQIPITRRLLWLLWVMFLALYLAVWLFPVSNDITRVAGCALLAVVWGGLFLLTWGRRPVRYSLLALTFFFAVFIALPGRAHPDREELRRAYVTGLERYEGDRYYWGGESPKGIDCSGLIRRGLIDSLFLKGIWTLDAELVRKSLWVWWNDCTAKDLLDGNGFTHPVLAVKSLNELDSSKIQLGDLAVTSWGSHVMAYLGDNRWIEADPGIGRVVIVTAPSKDNLWFHCTMKIVRWKMLGDERR